MTYRAIAASAVVMLVAANAAARPRRPALERMTATAYCDHGRTRSGVRAQSGVVAADPRHLPLGTTLRIVAPGEAHAGTYLVADTGAHVVGRALDIFMPSCGRARAFGRKTVLVRILRIGAGAGDARSVVAGRGGR